MAFKETFPNQRLRHARHLKGWSQSELAEALDTDFETVSRWERGITVPNPFYREKLCDLFQKNAEELGLQVTLNIPAFPLVFLASAYVDAEQSFVVLLKAKLQARGVTIWSSRTVRRHGEENKKKALQETIRAAQAILLIVSSEARTSRQVQETLRIANLYQQRIYTVWIDGEQWQECIPNIPMEIAAQFDARQPDTSNLLDEIIDRLEQSWLVSKPTAASGEIAELVPPSSESEVAFLKASATDGVRAKVNLIALLLLFVCITGLVAHQLFSNSLILSTAFFTTVTTLQEDGPGSLRAAIDTAAPGGTITFRPNLKGTIKLTADDLNIYKPLNIDGPGGGQLAISAGKSLHRIHIFKGIALSIFGLDFKDSTTTDLGFIYNSGKLTLTNDTISNNQTYPSSSGVDGGGIYNDGLLTLINSTVANNSAGNADNSGTSIGGGIFNVGTLVLTDSTVSGNQANIGGGIYSLGKLVLSNSTISNNAATGKAYSYGGGVAIEEGLADLNFSTIAGNITTRGGGISVEVNDGANPQLAIQDSLVENNYASIEPGISGEFVSKSYNLIQGLSYVSSGNPLQRTFLDTSSNAEAFLGISATLQDNGGPTQTLALLPGSPAADQIPRDACHPNGITSDQRGVKRPHGTELFCDIGAYES